MPTNTVHPLRVAIEEGRTTYFTGMPCKRGHVCKRVTASRACTECCKEKMQDPERRARVRKYRREFWAANPDKARKKRKRNYDSDPEKQRLRCASWKARNKDKVSEYNKKYYNADPTKQYERNAARRGLESRFKLTKDERATMKTIYWAARKLSEIDGIKRHVDHIAPLKGKNFCGLHVPWNLQILTAEENLKKRNKLILDGSSICSG